ncbi:MAG: hypothetical protein WDZ89_00365 [Gemmatimonadota bacterium]
MSQPAASPPATSDPRLPAPWGTHDIDAERTLPIRLGPLALWFRYRNSEIWIASAPAGDGFAVASQPPDAEQWVRWAVPAGSRTVRLVPVFPDRPIVVEPELSFRLLRHADARVYVRVTLWVRIELGDTGVTLLEIPIQRMSDTWFGGFVDGELCYWHPTTARREVCDELFHPHLAVCPLQLSNQSSGELNVQKIALRVAHLSLFVTGSGGFWADDTRVRYEGDELGSSVDMSGRPPDEAGNATLVTRPRLPIQRSFRTRTFARLKAFSGLGSAT